MLFRIFTLAAVLALAISTWILSSPAHRPQPPVRGTLAATPGYYLKDAVLTDYDEAGVASIRIEAGRIDQLAQGPEVELHDVHVRYQTPRGQNWLLFGDSGHIQPGGKVLDVSGNVRLQGESLKGAPAPVVHTATLTYDVPQAVATTAADVRIDFGAHSLTAHGLRVDLKARTMRLESKVNGRFQP